MNPPVLPQPKSPLRSASDHDALYDSRYFDEQLHHHHWFHNNAAKRELRWQEVLRMLEPDANDRILEIGCATGEHSLRLAPLVREVVGIDSAAAAIARAKDRARSENIHNARFLLLDATNLTGLADASFDKVAAIDFVEHINDAALLSALRETLRVLRQGGRLAIFTPCGTHFVERMKARNLILRQLPGHIAVRDPSEYQHLLAAAGFVITSLYFSPSTFPLAGKLDRWLWNAPVVGSLFRFRICLVAHAVPNKVEHTRSSSQ